jgi:intracellular septation protein
MKVLADLFPVLLFFAVYKLGNIYAATVAAMAAAALQGAWLWWHNGRLPPMQAMVIGLIVGLGALTLALHDPVFIKWKPTLVNWAFALVLIGGELIGRKGMLERLLGAQLSLTRSVWQRLSWSWIVFFAAMGALNLFVAYSYDLDTWVDFKLYGVLGLTLVFTLLQGLYLSRHLPATAATDKEN